jgi:hypothetical protein
LNAATLKQAKKTMAKMRKNEKGNWKKSPKSIHWKKGKTATSSHTPKKVSANTGTPTQGTNNHVTARDNNKKKPKKNYFLFDGEKNRQHIISHK